MTIRSEKKLPEWLSLDTARKIALGAKSHPAEGLPAVKGSAEREPRKPNSYGETRTFTAKAELDYFGPKVNFQWFTGDPSRGNKWTLAVPAEQILKLAEWILHQEPHRQAWWEWLKSSEQAIKREARESGIDLQSRDVFRIREQIVEHKESLINPGNVIAFSGPAQKGR